MYLESLRVLGIDNRIHDIRFVEDIGKVLLLAHGDWLGGLVHGMEISQFIFQQVVGMIASQSRGITYGPKDLQCYFLGDTVMDLPYITNSQRP